MDKSPDRDQPPFHVGDHWTDGPEVCVITRFHVRWPWHLVATWLDYRAIRKQARECSAHGGLIRTAFLIENLHTCYSLSVWSSYAAIPQFGTDVNQHVHAGNRMMGRLAWSARRRPDMWSTKWKLLSTSHNLEWADVDGTPYPRRVEGSDTWRVTLS